MSKREDPIVLRNFSDLRLDDAFFDSLRSSYDGFDEWFHKKANQGESAYVVVGGGNTISAMLYLKEELGQDASIEPTLSKPRLKIGTFKVSETHHTSVGKRLLAIALRRFAKGNFDYVYVTMFDAGNTRPLRGLLEDYGFKEMGAKGKEKVLFKHRPRPGLASSPSFDFPFINARAGRDYLLAIFPKYHDRLFGDMDLRQQRRKPIQDARVVNTIEKVYLSAAENGKELKPGDHVVSYRTKDPKSGSSAFHSSVISSIGTITDVTNINSFTTVTDFLSFIKGRSVFTEEELRRFYSEKKYPWIITFLYNFRFRRYPPRKELLEKEIISTAKRIVCLPIAKERFLETLKLGRVDESYIIH